MSIPSPIKHIAVVGASSAGLLSALTLKKFFPQLQVTVIYSSNRTPIGVGESTTAWIPQFLHDILKIDRVEFYKAVCPIWKLGIRFEWGQPGEYFFNYTFDRQFSYDSANLRYPIGSYALHDMNEASRFSVLMNKQHAPIWISDNNQIHIVPDGYGYHLGIQELTDFLFKKSKDLGVNFYDLEVLEAQRDASGNIQKLRCTDGKIIEADLFIDATGFQSKLLGQTMQEPFKSFSDRLFCDSAIVGVCLGQHAISPFTTATTMKSGWRWRIDLKDRISFGYVYSSSFCEEEDARQEFLQSVPPSTQGLRKISFRSGRYQRFWVNNVIALGNASGFVEPLESTGQHMIAEMLWRVVLDLQDSQLSPSPLLISTTNRYIAGLWDEICDFLTLHFKFNDKLNSPFWEHCRQETNLGKIQELVDLYQDSGACHAIQTLTPPASIFEVDGYLTLLKGQNLPVKHLSVLSDSDRADWQSYRQRIRQELQGSVEPRTGLEIIERYGLG